MAMKLIGFAGVPGSGKDTAAKYLQRNFSNVHILKFAHPLQDILGVIMGTYDEVNLQHRLICDNLDWKENYIISFENLRKYADRDKLFIQITSIICGVSPNVDVDVDNLRLYLIADNGTSQIKEGKEIKDLLFSSFFDVFSRETYTPRQVLQLMGTEIGRNLIGENLWISIMEDKLCKFEDKDTVLITDVRFENEVDLLMQLWRGFLVYIENQTALEKDTNVQTLKHESESAQGLLHKLADFRIHNKMDDKFFENVLNVYNTVLLQRS